MELFDKLLAVLKEGTWPVMTPLMLACLGIAILTVERALFLYDPRQLIGVILPPLRKRVTIMKDRIQHAFDEFLTHSTLDNRNELEEACRDYNTPYSRFLLTALGRLRRKKTADLVLEKTVHESEVGIEKGLPMLSMLAKAAPLMGLMGTVTGMIQTFSAMMVASTSDPKALSSGISIALVATNVGLVVSLPGVVAMSWLSRRAGTQEGEIRLASVQLRNRISGKAAKSEGVAQ